LSYQKLLYYFDINLLQFCNKKPKGYIMKKIIMTAALFAATTSMAAVDITANYEGTITDGNPGAASYEQDLDITMVGSAGGTTVTASFENLTGGQAVTANQVWVDTKFEGLNFKGGNFKTTNGSGLLQSEGAVANQMQVGLDVTGVNVVVGQVSGAGKATVDAAATVAGLEVSAENVTATDRLITVVANFFGFNTTVETQETSVARNTAVSAGLDVSIAEGTSVALTGVYIDVKDAAGVTQDDGILGDISDATTGSTVKGAVASLNTAVGNVTGKYSVKNDKNTITAEVERGVWTLGHTKTEDTSGVTTAKINVAF
jgi:hypothetical protein